MENDGLVTLLKSSWKGFDVSSGLSYATQVAMNLKIIKNVSITWSVKKKDQDNKDLVNIEALLVASFHSLGFCFTSEEDELSMVELESKKRNFLCEREQEARQKSKALWLLCGDDNTPFSIINPISRKILTLSGRLQMMREISLKVLTLLPRQGFIILNPCLGNKRTFISLKL